MTATAACPGLRAEDETQAAPRPPRASAALQAPQSRSEETGARDRDDEGDQPGKQEEERSGRARGEGSRVGLSPGEHNEDYKERTQSSNVEGRDRPPPERKGGGAKAEKDDRSRRKRQRDRGGKARPAEDRVAQNRPDR